MTVLSLFDGISCGLLALKRAGIPVKEYYASEIDESAIKVSKSNHPQIKHLGDVSGWKSWNIPRPDLILAGSPCQGFSYQGKGLNFDDPRSKLFFEFVEIVNHFKPQYWLLENVVMKQEWQDTITGILCVQPELICSSRFSAQTRPRTYWKNWPTTFPDDKHIHLNMVLESDLDWNPAAIRGRKINRKTMKRDDSNPDIPYSQMLTVKGRSDKMNCLTTVPKDTVLTRFSEGLYFADDYQQGQDWRYLTPTEYERLQTLPDGYTESVSKFSRYRLCGNAWTVDVVKYLMKGIGEV